MKEIDRENFLTVSEVAKILGINKNTILHYDREGVIFSKRDVNNYRYYHKNQIKVFKIILALRKSGFSLEEIKKIKEHIIDQNYAFIMKLIKNKTEELEKEIEELKNKLKMIKIHEKYIEYLNEMTIQDPENTKVDIEKYSLSEKTQEDLFYIKHSEEEKGVYINLNNSTGNCQDIIEEKLKEFKRDMGWLRKYFFGRGISKENILKKEYNFDKFIIKTDIEICQEKYIFQEGDYAFYYLKSDIKIKEAIKKMIEKIKESGYEVNGDLFVENLSLFDKEEKNRIRIIKILVKPLTSE